MPLVYLIQGVPGDPGPPGNEGQKGEKVNVIFTSLETIGGRPSLDATINARFVGEHQGESFLGRHSVGILPPPPPESPPGCLTTVCRVGGKDGDI